MMSAVLSSIKTPDHPLVKICGLTRPDEALACARMGADAIGLIFFPNSPRHLKPNQAADICRKLPSQVKAVAVCVDMPSEKILDLAVTCGFGTVQLHGRESPKQVAQLTGAGLRVIKALFASRSPKIDAAHHYDTAAAFLVECGQGTLPGGNAKTWDWQLPASLFKKQPVILAGGLAPDTVRQAIAISRPDAVDVSSGVETSPGRKDLEKVRLFLEAIKGRSGFQKVRPGRYFSRIF